MIHFTSWFISLYRYCLHICNLIMTSFPRKSSNRPSWSTMQNIRNDDRKVHDLCRSFRYLISWWHARRKLVYRVCTHLSLLCARSCCIQYEWLRWWYLSIYPIHAIVVDPTRDSMKMLTAIPCCEVYSISVLATTPWHAFRSTILLGARNHLASARTSSSQYCMIRSVTWFIIATYSNVFVTVSIYHKDISCIAIHAISMASRLYRTQHKI